jgi:hypothetical protein
MTSKGRDSEAEARRKRLASALRENLKRRKAQQRGRAAAAAPRSAQETDARRGVDNKI